jgi:hypothetical protein
MRFALVCLFALGCGDDSEGMDIPDPPAEKTTWYEDVGPIVATRCMGCHQEGGLAPFSLESYEDAAFNAQRMLVAVESGQMPPWGAQEASDCTPERAWRHDPRMTDTEIAVLRAWITDGRPAGEPAELVPASEERLTGVTHALVPTEPFTTSGATDQFMCFVLDPQLATTHYLTGWEVVPSNPAVVHHAVVLTLGADLLQAARNANVIGKPLPCSAVPMTQAIGAWAPGQGPTEMPAGIGAPMLANTGVLVQIHYHPANAVNDPDATAVNLRLSAEPPARLFGFGGWGNAAAEPALLAGPDDNGTVEFRVPAHRANHTETMRFTIDDPMNPTRRVPMFLMQPHQHYVGTRVELRIHRPSPPAGEPADECLINSNWNFDWQRTYQYDVPVEQLPTFGHGDTVEIKCTYDNSLANPFVQRALAELGLVAPIDVFLGEQSLDEMCLVLVGLIGEPPAAPQPQPN